MRIVPPPKPEQPRPEQAELAASVERHPSQRPAVQAEVLQRPARTEPKPLPTEASLSTVVHETYAPGVPDLAARVLADALATEDPLTRLKLTEHIYAHVGVTPASSSLTLPPGISGAVSVEIELTRRARLRTIAQGWDGAAETLDAFLNDHGDE